MMRTARVGMDDFTYTYRGTCPAVSPDRFLCTVDRGHVGHHVAGDGDKIVDVWRDPAKGSTDAFIIFQHRGITARAPWDEESAWELYDAAPSQVIQGLQAPEAIVPYDDQTEEDIRALIDVIRSFS